MGRFQWLDRLLGQAQSQEWEEVPIQGTIKRLAGAWVREGFNIEVLGKDRLPPEGGVILAANHASYFDPVFIGAVFDRPVHWMAKADLFRHPVTDFFFSKAGGIKVDRVSGGNQAAVEATVRRVNEGRVAGIFPEGSRSLDGTLRRGRTGVARVAMRTGAPVVPIAMTSYHVLPKHARVPHLDEPLVLATGEPRAYEGMAELATDRGSCRKVTDEIMDEIGRLLEIARTRQHALSLEEEA